MLCCVVVYGCPPLPSSGLQGGVSLEPHVLLRVLLVLSPCSGPTPPGLPLTASSTEEKQLGPATSRPWVWLSALLFASVCVRASVSSSVESE